MADKYEKIRVDLRPFGWGIRDVDVIPADVQPGPDSVGTEEIRDGEVRMEDLHGDVRAAIDGALRPDTVLVNPEDGRQYTVEEILVAMTSLMNKQVVADEIPESPGE